MAVKMRGFELPESYWCQNYYFDVTQSIPNNWICRAGEIAADHFVISRENGHLRPMETVTRAEAVAMMLSASCMRPVTPQQAQQVMQIKSYEFTTDTVDWQRRTLIRYDGIAPINTFHFEPNACSTRSEVFDFAVTFLDHTTDGNNCRSTLCDIVDTLESCLLYTSPSPRDPL